MSKASLELGGGNWGTKDGNLLAYAQGNESSNLVPREFTFTRGSDIAATRINSSGLIEKYRENLLLQSNQFDTTWTLNSTSVTSGQSGYDGSSDAWLLNSTTTGFPRIEQLVSASGVSTFSVYAKPATDGFALIRTFGAEATAWFDLINGTITNASGAQYVSSKIQFVGNGWYRCSVTFNGSLTTARIYPASAYGTYSTSGNGVYIQDTQIEKGLVATSYLESGATTATSGVADNEPRIDYTGGTGSLLLEPSRTNLIEYSEYFEGSIWETVNLDVKNNNAISPEGVQNAAKICETTTTNTKFRLRTNSSRITSGDNVLSIYAKAEERTWIVLREQSQTGVYAFFNLSGNGSVGQSTADNPTIEPLSDGWYKCSITDVLTAVGMDIRIALSDGVDSYDGVFGNGLYVYGAQIEQGSYPTSYIPTYGTSVTRAGEGQSSSDFSTELSTPLSNAYTLFLDFEVTNNEDTSLNFQDIFNFKFDELLSKDGVKIETYHIGGVDSIRVFVYKQSSGTQATSVAPNVIPMGSRVKLACVLDDSYGVKIFYNGTKIIDHQEITAYEQIKFLKGSGVNGNIRSKTLLNKVLAFSTALTDREAVDLTSPYSTYQELVTAEGLTWESPTCTTNSITELQSI